MPRNKHKLLLILVSLSFCVGLARSNPVSASSLSFKGVTITPAIEKLDIKKSQTTASFTIMVTNNTKEATALSASSLDFRSLNESGGVAFVTNDADQLGHKYGLASWLNIPGTVIELQPHQTKPINISVENRTDLSPGGHYAAVLFKATNATKGGNARVDINQVVSTLVFVRKIDGERYGISLARPSIPVSWWHLPSNIDLFFKNTGNVQAVPRGLITISSPLSKEVSRGIINTDSSLVLPESMRLSRTSLFATGHAWLPGWYHFHVAYHYDGSSGLTFYNGTFLYINLISVGVSLIILVAIWYVIRRIKKASRRGHKYHEPIRPPPKRIKVRTH